MGNGKTDEPYLQLGSSWCLDPEPGGGRMQYTVRESQLLFHSNLLWYCYVNAMGNGKMSPTYGN